MLTTRFTLALACTVTVTIALWCGDLAIFLSGAAAAPESLAAFALFSAASMLLPALLAAFLLGFDPNQSRAVIWRIPWAGFCAAMPYLATAADLRDRHALPLLVACVIFGVSVLFLPRWLQSRRSRRLAALAHLAVASAGIGLSYVIAHTPYALLAPPGIAVGALLGCSGLGWLFERERAFDGRLVVAAAIGVALALGAIAVAVSATELRTSTTLALRVHAPAASLAVRFWTPVSDLDGDGYSGLLGGADCAPFDASAAPNRVEVPGDGIDNNCLAGDADPQRVAALPDILRGPPAPAPGGHAERVLMITVDALRHDMALPRTERMLAGRCTAFPNAYVTYPMTTFSTTSTFASAYPSQLRYRNVREGDGPPLFAPDSPGWPTVGGLLGQAGWRTGAAVFHYYFHARLGLSRGFDEVWTAGQANEIVEGESSRETTDMALSWLRDREPPYFFWVHYYDPHEPYLRHPSREGSEGSQEEDDDRSRYEGEVDHADWHIARLLHGLGPTLAETAVIVTSDHGEAFGEHGRQYHSSNLHDEQARVPLWVCPPVGQPLPVAGPGATSLVDIAPTILDWTGHTVPDSFVGRSLLREPALRPVFSEILYRDFAQSVVDYPFKLIRLRDQNLVRLYNLVEDPEESEDIAASDPERRAQLEELLDVWLAFTGASGGIRGYHFEVEAEGGAGE